MAIILADIQRIHLSNQDEMLDGNGHHPESNKKYRTNRNTPWDMLRTTIIWQILKQRCAFIFKNKKLCLKAVIIGTWRNTIQIGMAVLKQIFKNLRSTATVHKAIANFMIVWCDKNFLRTYSTHNLALHTSNRANTTCGEPPGALCITGQVVRD